MSDDVWNDDIAYAFSTHRTLMQILGIWPLQKKTIFTIIQWNFAIILQSTSFIYLFMEFTGSHRNAGTSIEGIVFFAVTLALILKNFCITANQRKMARNINAAITDWLSAKNDKESYKIMKKHAWKSRLLTLAILYSAYICGVIYILMVVLINLEQIFLQDRMVNVSNGNASATDWMFIIPSGELGDKITGLQYAMLVTIQSIQLLLKCTSQSVADSFYINVTLHLTGQLKVLKTKFNIFTNKPDTQTNYRKQLTNLVNRHCELMELNQNMEDTFYLIILFQFVIVTLLLALLGLRIIFCLKHNDYAELAKSIVALNYLFMESLIYCYGGDFVQKGSESIFYAIFMTSWFTLPTTLIKDLNFVMMKSSCPFRLTGGKFFYVNRETIVHVLQAAASYISVLQMALKD